MSEYQYVAFRAVDAPVSDDELEYMQAQSSRAEITRWSFTNEYHYGDFRGNAREMLRRGYDIHLHYANFGIRKLMIRLPQGFPDSKAAQPYLDGESLKLVKDKKGPGGTLVVKPIYEPGDLEDLWDLDEMLEALVPLRAELLEGDLRPLYLAHLAVSCDSNHDSEETIEAPVPAGLGKPTAGQRALADLYELGAALIAAAAQGSPPLPSRTDPRTQYAQWLGGQPEAAKNAWLLELMEDAGSSLRAKILAEFRKNQTSQLWPAVRLDRTLAELQAAAEDIRQKRDRQAAAKAARQRAKQLAEMAADPQPYLRRTEQLVASRSTDAYRQASQLLADLREALAGTGRAGLAEQQARKLKEKNPALRHLTAALRREGFVSKSS